MKTKTFDYKLVTGTTPELFNLEVNKAIKDGFAPSEHSLRLVEYGRNWLYVKEFIKSIEIPD